MVFSLANIDSSVLKNMDWNWDKLYFTSFIAIMKGEEKLGEIYSEMQDIDLLYETLYSFIE